MLFICPKCQRKLNIVPSGAAVCELGHSYDRAKEGYYNLLMSAGGSHGDNAQMVTARRAFLEAGHYEPLAKRVAQVVAERLPEGGVALDSGCGEGYYTARVAASIGRGSVGGFDISKDAVRRAAKRRTGATLAVASAYKLPIADSSIDLIYNVFSPFAIDECSRVLRVGGMFLAVIPGAEHLFSLKEEIYDAPYKNTVADTRIAGFELLSREEVRYPIALESAEAVRSLFMMTPYAYRTSAKGRERVESLERLVTEAHFLLLLYRKTEE